jgi:hypothetical protein
VRIRKTTRKTIREILGWPKNLSDSQIDHAIKTASDHFYKYRNGPWEMALEGTVLYAKFLIEDSGTVLGEYIMWADRVKQ